MDYLVLTTCCDYYVFVIYSILMAVIFILTEYRTNTSTSTVRIVGAVPKLWCKAKWIDYSEFFQSTRETNHIIK